MSIPSTVRITSVVLFALPTALTGCAVASAAASVPFAVGIHTGEILRLANDVYMEMCYASVEIGDSP